MSSLGATTTTRRSSGCEAWPASSSAAIRARASLREGLEETLTVTRLGVRGALKKTLQSTNPCESMIDTVKGTSRNVKHWQNTDMCLRWTAAGRPEAEQQFRRVIGYPKLSTLALAVEREIARHTHIDMPAPESPPVHLRPSLPPSQRQSRRSSPSLP